VYDITIKETLGKVKKSKGIKRDNKIHKGA